jgi:hypothetical protein
MAGTHVLGQCAGEHGCSFHDFYSHHFSTYDGTGGHLSVENWLNDIEELLETVGCTEEQKVAYTTFKLGRCCLAFTICSIPYSS